MHKRIYEYLASGYYLCLFNYYNEWSYGCPLDPVVFKEVDEVEKVIKYIDNIYKLDSVDHILKDIDHCILLQNEINEKTIIKYRLIGFFKEVTFTYSSSTRLKSDEECKRILQEIPVE